jgi:(R,R)-butanediol dehydrogenase / meso-butanediol dehydrogenase / diacetyl reductase
LALPEVMPVAVYNAPGDIEVQQIDVPVPGPGEVLIEVGYCGICGSDLHLMVEGWGKPGFVGGHETSGVIAAVGEGVSPWKPGDEVVVGPSPRCGTCRRCIEGKPSQCEQRGEMGTGGHMGAFAGFVLEKAAAILPIPDGLSRRAAALAEPLAVALHGITRSGVQPGDSAMVFGAGPIGALTVAALIAKGIDPVIVVEPGLVRRRLAEKLGASEVVEPADLELFKPWEPDKIASRAVDVVLECSGKKAAMEAGLSQLRRGGRLVLVGAGMEPPSFDPNRLLLNELEVCGSFIYDEGGFSQALDLLASGLIPIDVLIEPDDVPLGGLIGALVGLADGSIAGKVMVNPQLTAPTKSTGDEP